MVACAERGAASGIGDQRPPGLPLGLTVTAAPAVPGVTLEAVKVLPSHVPPMLWTVPFPAQADPPTVIGVDAPAAAVPAPATTRTGVAVGEGGVALPIASELPRPASISSSDPLTIATLCCYCCPLPPITPAPVGNPPTSRPLPLMVHVEPAPFTLAVPLPLPD